MIILPKTILIRYLGTISYPYTPSDHQIYKLIISLHLKIDCVDVYGHLMYDITKMRLLLGCVYYTVKTILIRHLGTISYPYTPSDHQIYLLIISLHLKIDCVNVYGHLMYDITKMRLLLGCVDYIVKTILIRHLGTISYPYTPSDHQIYLLIISLHLKIDCVDVYGHLMYDITKMRLLLGCVDYIVKTILIRHLGTISYPYTPSDHQIYKLIISLHLKIDCVDVYGHLMYDITKMRL